MRISPGCRRSWPSIETDLGDAVRRSARLAGRRGPAGLGAGHRPRPRPAPLIAELPELGRLDRRQIASLVGVAPLNRDSGTFRGRRMVMGGRADVRTALYMPTAHRHPPQPRHPRPLQRLTGRGKPAKVAHHRRHAQAPHHPQRHPPRSDPVAARLTVSVRRLTIALAVGPVPGAGCSCRWLRLQPRVADADHGRPRLGTV